jgi:hypothetical protein
VPPSQEYLGLIKELSECRDDDSLNLVKTRLQKVLDRESLDARIERRIAERYKRLECSAHMHFHDLHIRGVEVGRFGLCAVLHSYGGRINHLHPLIEHGGFVSSNGLPLDDCKVTMLVDVREGSDSSEPTINLPSIVRLYHLDECKRLFGYPRQSAFETIEGGRFFRSTVPHGESTVFFPVNGQCDSRPIEFDQAECQVIESRSDLIDDLSSKDGNICRGKFREFKFVTSIRLFGNYARLITKEIHNDASYGVDLLFSPDQFKLGGFNGVGHP